MLARIPMVSRIGGQRLTRFGERCWRVEDEASNLEHVSDRTVDIYTCVEIGNP
jgi:hypothetical protein